mmetsp:Transcript_19444/g.23656  ORF Transcript_19444/g.23656 Transcript_19444/m.23656 type:complete len:135 (-) Transcript_19444:369-773(-)
MYFVGVQAVYAKHKVRKVFEDSIELHANSITAQHMEKVKDTLIDVQTNFVKQGFIFGTLYLILFTPFLWNKYDYFLPITCVGMNIGATKMISTLPERKHTEDRISATGKKSAGIATSSKVLTVETEPRKIEDVL